MEFKLRQHQQNAVDAARPILTDRGVVLLALEMRLGKTLCALQLASEIEGNILFVTKKAAIPSILADSELMGGFGDRLTVCNYEGLHKLKFGGFSVVVLDEVHRLSAFPKPCKAARLVRGICAGAAKVVMLSGTPAIESSSQWFNIFWATARGPWVAFGSGPMAFYKWFKGGGYGIPTPIRISGGQEVESYKRVSEVVASEVAPYAVCMTQQEVGFKQRAQVVPHLIDDSRALSLGDEIEREGILEIEDRAIVAENPAAILQKKAMICGGTVLDDDGEVLRIGNRAKLDYMVERLSEDRQYAIFTQYIAERDLILDEMHKIGRSAGDDMEAFKAGDFDIFVGSIKRYCEGVDLSWLDGAMVIYSLTFSGSTYSQILDRMCNWERREPIKVHVLMVRGSVEEGIFDAVSSKQSFNESFYKKAKR